MLLYSDSTKVVVNGMPRRSFSHVRGLCQGDPISPLLFVIAMEASTALFKKAYEDGVLSLFPGLTTTQCLSIYADDVVLFVRPTTPNLAFIKCALAAFGEASCMHVNYRKSSAILIKGMMHIVHELWTCFSVTLVGFHVNIWAYNWLSKSSARRSGNLCWTK